MVSPSPHKPWSQFWSQLQSCPEVLSAVASLRPDSPTPHSEHAASSTCGYTLVCKQTPTSLTISETHLETVKHLCGIACTELQFEQFLVLLLTTLIELLVLNLELIKVHLMTDLTSLLLLHTRQEVTVTYTCWYWSSSYQNTYLFQLGLQLLLLDTKSRVL